MSPEIRVALFKDIFWNNNSEAYPTTVPDIALFDVYKDPVNPVFISPYEGWIILEGDYNYCVYEGVYYHLRKIRLDDKAKKVIKYQMIYDIMINFISHGGSVFGNIIRTNNIEWLSKPEVLQTTIPFLENPARCIYGSFGDSEFSWTKDCKIYYPTEEFKEHCFTEEAINMFLRHINNHNLLKKIRKEDVLSLAGDVYIYSYLPTKKFKSWKQDVIDYIKKELADLSKFTIATASQLSDSPLRTHKCITYKTAAIGTTETEYTGVKQIDLSGLSDIKPITFALTPDEPRQRISMDAIPFDDTWHPVIDNDFLRKLSRLPYLPLKTARKNIERDAYLPLQDIGGDRFRFYYNTTDFHGYYGNPPQKVKFKDSANITSHTGYLWSLDRMDFALVVDGNNYRNPGNWDSDNCFFRDIERYDLPPLGFLVYEPHRPRSMFRGNEYLSDAVTTKLKFRTGISKKLLEKYGDVRGKWWENASPQLAKIRGAQELTFHALETDLFSWMYLGPKCKPYNYQYQYDNDWGVLNILKRNEYYTTSIVKADIPGRDELNPFNKNRIRNWLNKRQSLIDDISIYEDVELLYPLHKGDIFSTSINSRWTDFPMKNVPQDMKNVAIGWGVAGGGLVGAVGGAAMWGGVTSIGVAVPPAGAVIAAGLGLTALISGAVFATNEHTKGTYWNWYNDATLADIMNSSETMVTDWLNNHLVLYSVNTEIRLGIYREYTIEVPLSSKSEQIVENVDNVTKKRVTVYHIQALDDALSRPNLRQEGGPLQKNFILSKALEAVGLGKNGNMGIYNTKFLEKEQQLFDLVDTNWYVLFKSGHIHLIAKNERDFFKTKPIYHSVEFKTKETLSLIEKINQRAIISIYGTSKNLATKFHLEKDEFDFHTEVFDIQDKISSTDYIHVISENPFDYINEIVQIPKKTLQATAAISIVELETLKHQIREANQREFIEKAINKNLYDQQMRYFDRQRQDATLQIISEGTGVLGAGLSTAALGGMPVAVAGASNIKGVLFNPDATGTDGALNKTLLARHAFWGGRYMSGLAMAGARTIQGIPSVIKTGFEFGRITEDEQAFVEKTNLEILQREYKYSNNYKKALIDLNRTTTSYVRRDVNDRDVLEKLRQQGKPEIHLQLYVPTSLQLKKCKAIFDIYGVECYIPNKEVLISDGMDPQIVQFDFLSSDGVSSEITTDSYLNEHVRFLFTQGVLFVKHKHIPIHPKSIEFIVPAETKWLFDINKITEWTSEEWDRYIVTAPANKINDTIKKLTHYGLTEEEYNKYKDDIDPNNPIEAVNKIISNRDRGLSIILRPKTQHELDVEELEKKIADCDAEKEKLKTDLTTQLEECNQEKTKLQTDLTSASNRADTLSKNVKRLEGELTQEQNLKNLLQAEVNQMRPKIQTLETEKTHLNEQVTNLTQALEECRVAIPKNPYDVSNDINRRKIRFYATWQNALFDIYNYEDYKKYKNTPVLIAHIHLWNTIWWYGRLIEHSINMNTKTLNDIKEKLKNHIPYVAGEFLDAKGITNADLGYTFKTITPDRAKIAYDNFKYLYGTIPGNHFQKGERVYKYLETLYEFYLSYDSYTITNNRTNLKSYLKDLFDVLDSRGKLAITVYTYSYFSDDVEYGITERVWKQ